MNDWNVLMFIYGVFSDIFRNLFVGKIWICTLKGKRIFQHVKYKYVSTNFMALSMVWVIKLYSTVPIMNGFEKRLSKYSFVKYKLYVCFM